jgi:beta-glucosidase
MPTHPPRPCHCAPPTPKGRIRDNATGDVACDHFNRYKEDFALMKEMGIKHYR